MTKRRFMVRQAFDDFRAFLIGDAMTKAGAEVASVIYVPARPASAVRGEIQAVWLVYAVVTEPLTIDAVDRAIDAEAPA